MMTTQILNSMHRVMAVTLSLFVQGRHEMKIMHVYITEVIRDLSQQTISRVSIFPIKQFL